MGYNNERNWSIYNERLVRRGEFYLTVEFLDQWDQELERMNQGKRGLIRIHSSFGLML